VKKNSALRSSFSRVPVLISFALLCSVSALAATITVTNTNDSGPGSLRQALADATDGDTINFSVSGIIRLTSDQLTVNANIVIDGPGANMLTVDGDERGRVFYISSGKTVSISGLTITRGKAGLVDGLRFGGGIFNDHSTLTVSDCALRRNSADSGGGGIFNDGRGGGTVTLSIANSTLDGNETRGNIGGGILNSGRAQGKATLSITNSTLNANSARLAGGGIYNDGAIDGTAMLTVRNSTLSFNEAQSFGGGIYNDGNTTGRATLLINNSTLSRNVAIYGGCAGILNDHAALMVSNCTLSGNSAIARRGVGILNKEATLQIGDTILNAEASDTNILNDRGKITSLGYNLTSDNGGGVLTGAGDQINTDPMLGPLQDNGGPTVTHAPLTGSPAIDMGDPNFTPPPDYDQRGSGYSRVVNSRLDIGAIEVQAPTRPTPTPRPEPTPAPRP